METEVKTNQNTIECPNCGSTRVVTRIEDDTFQYRVGSELIEITANRVPFRKCEPCSFEFTDYEAEDVRSEAIRRYLETQDDEVQTN